MDEFQNKLIKALDDIDRSLGAIFIALFLIVFFLCGSTPANAAESAIVSFNDAEHLAALQDSVVGVRDTVGGYWYNPDCPEDTVWYNKDSKILAWLPNCEEVGSLYDSTYQVNWRYVDKAITCRELVCVTIEIHRTIKTIRNPRTGESMEVTVKPGEALIFYEEVKE